MRSLSQVKSRGPLRGLMGTSAWGLLAFGLATASPTTAADLDDSISQPNRLSLVRRSVQLEFGTWIVDYQIRNETAIGVSIAPSEIEVKSDGWVSNSRVVGHASPRRAQVSILGVEKATADGELIADADETARCAERITLGFWSDDQVPDGRGARPSQTVGPLAPISLAPGETGLFRLWFMHHHVVHGAYDPLLGERTVAIRIGQETFHDVIPLDREPRPSYPKDGWPEPPEDRRDPRHFVSGPDSLHLEAHIPGRQYYRFSDRPVRRGARMRLTFWYLIAHGTSGECRARLIQYKDTPTACRPLPKGGFDRELTVVGRWTQVETVVRMEHDATNASLDFRISSDANLGEMWIDDVLLEPLDVEALAQGP